MSFYLVIGIIAGIALLVLIATLIKAAPRVTVVDADALPQEKAAQRKKEIINERFSRAVHERLDAAKDKVTPVFSGIAQWGSGLFRRLTVMERRVERKLRVDRDPREYVNELMASAAAAMEKDDRAEAERKLVEIISVDAKNENAYRMLGELYVDGRQYQEAWEVLTFLLKLTLRGQCGESFVHSDTAIAGGDAKSAEKMASTCSADVSARTDIAKQYATLGEVATALGKGADALSALELAVAFEASNPRYLDLLLEACILEKQKKRAKEVLAQLREVNPENQKLEELAEQIAEL